MKKCLLLMGALMTLMTLNDAFCQLVSTKKEFQYNFNMVHHNPGEVPFVSKYNDPKYLSSAGFNGQVIRVAVPCAVSYAAFDKDIAPKGSALRTKIDHYSDSLNTLFNATKAAGLQVYPFTDLLVIPKEIFSKYETEIVRDGKQKATEVLGGTRLDATILKVRTQEILRAQVNEIFDKFPVLDGLVTRFGETYLHEFPEYMGGTPARSVEEHIALINLLREEICVKRNKKLFFRTWDFGNFHTRPEYYLNVTNAIEPHPNLVFSIKHVQGDFLRLYPFNPNLGSGKHGQIVEVSMNTGGLNGKNAHPYYIGQGVIDGWEENAWINIAPRHLKDLIKSPKFKGIWTWSKGDGWAGPYLTNELWVDINNNVFNEFYKTPNRSEEVIFHEVVKQRLGLEGEMAEKLRKIALLSASATMHGQATIYAHVNDWWCRDEYITAVDLTGIVKQNLTELVLIEKANAVKNWETIEKLSKEIELKNKEDEAFLRVSCTYGKIKYQIFEQVWKIQLLVADAKVNKKEMDRTALKTAAATYETLWAAWRNLEKTNKNCPTLYKDDKAVHCPFPPFAEALKGYQKL